MAGPVGVADKVWAPGAAAGGRPMAPIVGRLSLPMAGMGRAGMPRTTRLGGPVCDCIVGCPGVWRGGPPPMCVVVGGRGPYPTDMVFAVWGVVGGRGPHPTGTVVGIWGDVGGRGPDPTIRLLSVPDALACAWDWYPG